MEYKTPIINISKFVSQDIITASGESESYISAQQYADELKKSGQVADRVFPRFCVNSKMVI